MQEQEQIEKELKKEEHEIKEEKQELKALEAEIEKLKQGIEQPEVPSAESHQIYNPEPLFEKRHPSILTILASVVFILAGVIEYFGGLSPKIALILSAIGAGLMVLAFYKLSGFAHLIINN